MGLGAGAVDALFDADVELLVVDLDPEAAAAQERVGLGGRAQAEDVDVEVARGGFVGRGDGDLDVVNVLNHGLVSRVRFERDAERR